MNQENTKAKEKEEGVSHQEACPDRTPLPTLASTRSPLLSPDSRLCCALGPALLPAASSMSQTRSMTWTQKTQMVTWMFDGEP